MSDAMPTRMLKLKIISEVPRSEFMDAPRCENPRDQSARRSFIQKLRKGPARQAPIAARKPAVSRKRFNAAAWLRFQKAPSQPISLWLVYRDERDEFAVMLDEAKLGEGTSAMLSGCADIDVKGDIEYMQVCCGGARADDTFTVDELFVQKQPLEQAQPGIQTRIA